MRKTLLSTAVAVLTIVGLSSCATMRGIGEDLQKLGEGMSKLAIRASKN